MKKDALVFIKHIRDFLNDLEDYTKKQTRENFMKNKIVQDAVFRKIEVIGEAVKNLPGDFTDKYPGVPWKDIVGMRDKLIHHYFGVDLEKVWNVIKDEVPILKKEIHKILEEEK